MQDYPILDIDDHLAASKNRQYHETTFAYYKALTVFLQAHGLLLQPLLAAGEFPQPGFRIMRSHLTDEGFALVKKALDKWLAGVSSGKIAPDDVKLLEKALANLRG